MAIRIDQINVVVSDVAAVAQFLQRLGVDLPAAPPGWADHHRTLPTASSLDVGHDLDEPTFGIDLDSSRFAADWGGLDPAFTGVVVNLRLDTRAEVDRLHQLAVAEGASSLRAPYDAFFGARYAVVQGPASLVVGFMSVPEPARRTVPPDPTALSA